MHLDCVAVTAVHAALFVDHDALQVLIRMRPDGAGGASGDGGGNFAQVAQFFVGHFGRSAVDAQDGDIGTVHRAAHVQAAGQSDAHLGRQLVAAEVFIQIVHHRLDDTGGVDGRGVAVDPTLGMDDVESDPGPVDCRGLHASFPYSESY